VILTGGRRQADSTAGDRQTGGMIKSQAAVWGAHPLETAEATQSFYYYWYLIPAPNYPQFSVNSCIYKLNIV
jgi:hypothetical protein